MSPLGSTFSWSRDRKQRANVFSGLTFGITVEDDVWSDNEVSQSTKSTVMHGEVAKNTGAADGIRFSLESILKVTCRAFGKIAMWLILEAQWLYDPLWELLLENNSCLSTSLSFNVV